MAAFFDNRLDEDYLNFDTVGSYVLASVWTNGSAGAVTTLRWFGPSGSMGKNIRIYLPKGTSSRGGRESILRLVPAFRDIPPGGYYNFIPVTPRTSYTVSLSVGLSGSVAGWNGFGVSLDLAFADSSGNYISGSRRRSDPVWPPHFTTGGTPLTLATVAPDNAAYIYTNLVVGTSEAGTLVNDLALHITGMALSITGTPAKGGVAEVGASTNARLGIVSDIYSRSREKIQLKLAGVDDLVRSGHRIELAAAAMTSTPAVWHWRQVTGPTVALNVKGNTCDFIAPDVEKTTRVRIGVYAASEDGSNRSDWRYFDLNVEPPMLRFRGEDDGDFSPRSPYLVGYSRGKREIWNDVIRPTTYEKNPRHEPKKLDLGIPDDDVVFSTTMPKRMAAGGVWVNPETGDVFRNFGAGYNETDDTTASPRTSTYWVNPANGDILEWIED